MMLHPLVLAIFTVDVASAALLILAGYGNAQILAGWNPSSSSRLQLDLERRAEAVSLQARWATALFVIGSVLLVVGVSGVLPTLVPGAMCGTGVVQASSGLLGRALTFRLLALALLAMWRLTDRLDRSAPTFPIIQLTARIELLSMAAAVIAIWNTMTALASLDVHTPVDCCSVVFDQVRSAVSATTTHGIDDTVLVIATFVLLALLLALALGFARRRRLPGLRTSAALAITAPITVTVAGVTLIRVLSAYHYGVLHHHCPWCLFLKEHHLVGYPLFGALGIMLISAWSSSLATGLATVVSGLGESARHAAQRHASRVVAAILVFAGLTALPPLLWRLRFGVWLTG